MFLLLYVFEMRWSEFTGKAMFLGIGLGAWGGDFIIASGGLDSPRYFNQKGFKTVITFEEMIYSCK